MQVGQFPASAANSLIQGYCDDFVSLAAVMAQTLEQVSIRGIKLDHSRPALERIERGMLALASAIHEMLERGTAPAALAHPVPGEQKEPPAASPTNPVQVAASTAPVPPRQRTAPTAPPAAPPAAPKPPARLPSPPPPVARTRPSPVVQHQATRSPVSISPSAPRETRTETLRGTNRSMPLLSVFQFLGRMRKSGTMFVFSGDEKLAFEFANGLIQSTASDQCPPGERLGELLVERGSCTAETLAPIVARLGVSSTQMLGQVLEGLEDQVKRRFQRVCNDPDVSYQFEEGRRPPGDGRIRIAPFELAFEPTRAG
jgi:hypothetical protein